MNGIAQFARYILKEHGLMIGLCCLLGVVTALFAAGLNGTACFIIATAAVTGEYAAIMLPVVFVRFFGLGRAALSYGERLYSHHVTFLLLKKLRLYLYDSIMPRLPNPQERNGTLLSMLVTDVETLQNGFLRFLYPIFNSIVLLLVGIEIAYRFHPYMAILFGLCFMTLAYLLPTFLFFFTHSSADQKTSGKADAYNTLLELYAGIAEISANSLQKLWLQKTNDALRKMSVLSSGFRYTKACADGLLVLLQGVSLVAILSSACLLTAEKRMAGVLLGAAVLTLTTILNEAAQISHVYSDFKGIEQSASRVFRHTASEETQGQSTPVPAYPDFPLRLEHVSFSFSEAKPLIQDLTFDGKAGQAIAFIGSSGCGKSTLINLILGFLQPQSGQILINKRDLSSLSESDRLRLFSVVDQRPFLFQGTVRDNLLIGNQAADETELLNALHSVSLLSLIQSLPQELDTLVNERGANFSGGELQRLAIARALLKDAPFFIFDEPTAGLDPVNEKKIMELILTLSKTRCVLVVTHRRVLLEQFDQVIHLAEYHSAVMMDSNLKPKEV